MSIEILRDLSLGVNFIEIAVLAELFILYIKKCLSETFSNKYQLLQVSLLRFFPLFFIFARIVYIVHDYYIFETNLLIYAWIFLITGFFLLGFDFFYGTLGTIFKKFPHKTSIVLYCSIGVIVAIVFRFIPLLLWMLPVLYGIGFLIIIPPAVQFNNWIKKVGGHLKNLRYQLIGLFLYYFGVTIGSSWTVFPLEVGYMVKLSSHLIFLMGVIFFTITILSIPSSTEIGWEEKLRHLYVITQNGLCAYEYKFREEITIDSDLLTSGLSGVVTLVQEMTKSEKRLKIIKQEKNNIFLEYGEFVTIVLIAKEELRIIYDKIAEFLHEFEEIFSENLRNWDGNVDIFKIADILIKKLFLISN